MLNYGGSQAIDGKPEAFTRLLAEAIFDSLQRYERALTGMKLLPILGDMGDVSDMGDIEVLQEDPQVLSTTVQNNRDNTV